MADNEIEIDSDEYESSEGESSSSIASETLNGDTSSHSSSSGDDKPKKDRKKSGSKSSPSSEGDSKGALDTAIANSGNNSVTNSLNTSGLKRNVDNKREIKLSSHKKRQAAILE